MSQLQTIKLADLKDNPMRDFTIDPIDDSIVMKLKESIEQDGFWGGVVARPIDGTWFELACGHHRVRAARAANIEEATILIKKMDDEAMVRVYARENASQRGNSATALIGSVASAIRFVVRQALARDSSGDTVERVRRQLSRPFGLGAGIIMPVIGTTSSASVHAIEEQIATLKASGDYQKIIDDCLKELRGKISYPIKIPRQSKKTFDLARVSKHFTRDVQLNAFRRLVTKETVANHLPLESQAPLAEALRKKAEESKKELSVAFIHEHTVAMVLDIQGMQRRLDHEARQKLHRESAEIKLNHEIKRFTRHTRGMINHGEQINGLLRQGVKPKISGEFLKAVIAGYRSLAILKAHLEDQGMIYPDEARAGQSRAIEAGRLLGSNQRRVGS
jgi:hypothetical protein